MIKLQGHRGVCTEYPENTMTSFFAAIEQGYDYIEVDPEVTLDGTVVLLHDSTVGRTGRNDDESEITNNPRLCDITYEDALKYDFGVAFHKKFKKERIPKLTDTLELVKKHGVKVKIDNKIWNFDFDRTKNVLSVCAKYAESVAITCNNAEQIEKTLSFIDNAEIHYDGEVSEKKLILISSLVPKERLVVWLPIQCSLTSWVNVPFASKELCALVKKYSSLGIWTVEKYSDFDIAKNEYDADIVETNGQIKPQKNKGIIADMHTHTGNSHDSKSDIFDICESAIKNKIDIIAITDHFDGVRAHKADVYGPIESSVKDASNAAKKYGKELTVLKGVEYGEAFWAADEMMRVNENLDLDVRIGSVHAVRYENLRCAFSVIDFSKLSLCEIKKYFSKYLDDMMENLLFVDFDILAHLDNPNKYIKGKFGFELDMSKYSEKIDCILKYIIDHGIALEINTSTLEVYGDNMPSRDIVRRYVELGGYLITIGADSHIPNKVGYGINEAVSLIKELGLRNIFYYKNKRSYQITL